MTSHSHSRSTEKFCPRNLLEETVFLINSVLQLLYLNWKVAIRRKNTIQFQNCGLTAKASQTLYLKKNNREHHNNVQLATVTTQLKNPNGTHRFPPTIIRLGHCQPTAKATKTEVNLALSMVATARGRGDGHPKCHPWLHHGHLFLLRFGVCETTVVKVVLSDATLHFRFQILFNLQEN